MKNTIASAVAYLRTVQQQDGSFLGYSSRSPHSFKAEKTYQTTFTPALILGALAGIPEATEVRRAIAGWLLAERGPGWSFNYWAVNAPERLTTPYPNDLDDTFCALSALYHHDASLVDAAALGEIVQVLLAAESQVGGPYRTWLVSPDAAPHWQDVDLAVNANIAYFLRFVADPLPNVTSMMEQAVTTGTYGSPYYPDALTVAYFIARAYTGRHTQALAAFIDSQTPRSALGLALQCTARVRLGAYDQLRTRIERLCAMQQADGSWPAAGFCMDPAQGDTPYYQGAPALTTAFALEAIHHFNARPTQARQPLRTVHSPEYQAIIAAAKQPFASLQDDLRATCEQLADLMGKGDHSHEIAMLPQLFTASLATPPAIPPETLQQLSLANVYGWMAYTVLDDFLDEEGSPALLPAATVSLRASLDAFAKALPGNAAFQQYVRATFDIIDGANTWEVNRCRQEVHDDHITLTGLPRFGKLERLADRSLGHALTPLAVLILAGHDLHSQAATSMLESVRHYLIARQLQDDMHDWERDIRSGQLNAVVAEILRDLRLPPDEYAFTRLIPRMLNSFWQRVLPVMCTRALRHITRARRAANASNVLRADSPLYTLYDRLETATNDTRASQAEALAFLEAYKKPLA